MKRFASILAIVCCSLLVPARGVACTTFVLKENGRIYFGRNLDWNWEQGLVIVNPRGIEKTAFVAPQRAAAKWAARYGSVTFNQFGREMPFGGMNEAGLVIEALMLADTKYPAADARPEINMLQWIQYQLDNCRTVAEVAATDRRIRLEQPTLPARIHYLICDAQGGCATIEFLDGKLVWHQGKDLPYPVLANSTYKESTAYARAHAESRPAADQGKDPRSLSRFARAAARAADFRAGTRQQDIQYAFDTLDQVCQTRTVWRVVYDIPSRRIHFRTRGNQQQRSLDLESLDFSCRAPVVYTNVQSPPSAAGGIEFQGLSEERHREYLQAFFRQDSVRQRFGDLSPVSESLLRVLRGYQCGGQ